MTLLLATTLVVIFAILVVSVLRPPTRIVGLVGWYLLSYANVVFVAEVAGTLHSLDPLSFLFLHFGLVAFAVILWAARGRPPLVWRSLSIGSLLNRRRILNTMKSDPALYALAAGVALVYLVGAIMVLTVPPNNYDSMTYHLSRVGYWLQHDSFEPWPTPNLRQTTSPMNAELGFMWAIIFSRTDQLAGFVQWSAALASMAAIAGLSRLLGASRTQAMFAALLWATLPEIILQSTTTQNDLLAGAFCAIAVYLLYVGIESGHKGTLLLSGLGVGLALGTKVSVPGVLPGLGATALLLLWRYGKRKIGELVTWSAASLTAFLLVGVYAFALNTRDYNRPLGPSSFVRSVAGPSESWISRLATNIPRCIYQTVDLTGLPDPAAEPLHQIKADVSERVFSLLNLPTDFTPYVGEPGDSDLRWRAPVHEDFAGFGPLGFLLLVPATIYHVSIGFLKRDAFRVGLALMSISFLVTVCPLGFYPFDNRYFVVTVTLCAPFVALFLSRSQALPALRWAITGLALLVAAWTITHNLSKPLTGPRPVWQMDRTEAQSINGSPLRPMLRAVENLIPSDATLGTMLHVDDWDYPLFGREFTREIIPLFPPPEVLDPDRLATQDIAFVLASDRADANLPAAAANLQTLWSTGRWYVLYTGDADVGLWDSQLRSGLAELAWVLVVDQRLAGAVGVAGLALPEWGDDWSNQLIWLGQNEGQGINMALWAERELTVELALHVTPGPGRLDSLRTVHLTLENVSGIRGERAQFDRTTALSFIVRLVPGRNEITFQCLDEPTVLVQPNGDTRPLLVRLDSIRVTSIFDQGQAGPAEAPLVKLDPALTGVVGISSQLETPPWNVELDGEGSFLWLGRGDDEGMGATLWSNEEITIDLSVDAAPGPGRPDNLRNIYLSLQNDTGEHREIRALGAPSIQTFTMQLERGRNDLIFGCLDEATVLEQPNGDTRPLLVLLREVRITRRSGS
jgi:4-amino-4-deoxy-L-arabinose transferase-like glycosyltransferase